MSTVDEALRWARIHAVRHMAACETADVRWGETSITEVVMSRAAKAVTVSPFTQNAEAVTGADWVWWWVDGNGAYGMLIQAKRVTVTSSRWKFDFEYANRHGPQRASLMSTAAAWGLLPAYALYLGTGTHRSWERCSDRHSSGRCIRCVKRSISLMPALLAESSLVSDATSTYGRSVALEDVTAPTTSGASVIPSIGKTMAPDLLKFLTTQQVGTGAVARAMADQILRVRSGQFSAATSETLEIEQQGAHDILGPVFATVPDDVGHWGLPYFQHVLNPLRHAPPDYVLNIISDGDVPEALEADMRDSIAGIVVVQLSQNG